MLEAVVPQSEDAVVPQSEDAVFKGKRTKRRRLPLPPASSAATSTSSGGSATEEEEDMANCLILLAQGQALEAPLEDGGGGGAGKFTGRKFATVYECKTCNRCFPSFQALGGHRASHKKLKTAAAAAEIAGEAIADEDDVRLITMDHFTKSGSIIPAGNSNNKTRVHECSICGLEFTSGQALGGHMRRHRPATVPEAQAVKEERSVLLLDLNLPAPDEFPPAPFPFVGKQPLLFSASALVDCHF